MSRRKIKPLFSHKLWTDPVLRYYTLAWLIFGIVAMALILSSCEARAAECEAIPVYTPPQKLATIGPMQHDDPRYFDVMMVGTIEAVARHGGMAGFQAWAADLIAWNNQVLSRSAIRSQLRLVNVAAWNHHDSGSATTDLYALSNDSDIYALKNLYCADAIQGDVVSAGNVCGTGFIMSSPSSGFPAVSIVADGCAKSNYSSIHEFGHNFGLAHNQSDAGSAGCGPCSYGSGTSSPSYCCYMSYVHGQTRLGYASNGGSPKYSAPTGTQITLGYANANAAYTINSLTSQTIADWRMSAQGGPTPTPQPTATPSPGSDFVTFPATIKQSLTVQITYQLTGPKQVQIWIDGPKKLQISPGSYIANTGNFQWTVTQPVGAYFYFVKGYDKTARVSGTQNVQVVN